MPTTMELLDFDYMNPIKCIYHRPIGKKYVVPHWHEAIEIDYIVKGNPGETVIDNQKYQLEEGDIFVINSRLIHSFDTMITPDQRILTLLIDYKWLSHCLPKTMQNKNFELIKTPKKASQMAAFKSLKDLINNMMEFHCQDTSEVVQLDQLSAAVQFISVLVRNFTADKEVEPEIPSIISKLIVEFHNQYSDDIQLSDVAKKYNYSYAYFSKLFKKYLGVSPKRYLTLLRVQKASELIDGTDEKLAQIAIDTGFPDEKSFYTAFREKYGQTPLEYRKRLRAVN